MTLADDNRSGSVGDDISHDISHDAVIHSGTDLEVLDLRVADPSHQVGFLNGKQSDDFDSCGVIDLSVNQRTDDSFPAEESSSTTNSTPGSSCLKSLEQSFMSKSASDIPSSDNGGQCHPVNVFALQTMNRLLEIYGFTEESDLEDEKRLKKKPLPAISANAFLWPPSSDLANTLSVLPKLNVSNSLSIIPDDQDLTKSSMSPPPSNQSMETSGNASLDEDSSHHPGLLVNSKTNNFLLI